ncbi:MAG: HAD family hydrolase [Dehalococcoidales bacterium]|nr:MAG: HAD family hydrolase [Dehalococcoidales bacterium]
MTTKPLPAAIILDLDDTILEYGDPEECWRTVCSGFVSRIGVSSVDVLLGAINEARDWFWRDLERHRQGRLDLLMTRQRIVAMAFSQLDIDAPEVAIELAETYAAKREGSVQPFSGAIDTLQHFRNRGVRLGLVTNGGAEMQRGKLERFGLVPYFDCILIEGEFGAGKPDASVFLHMLKQLDVAASNTWMVGDDLQRDIAGAQALGLFTIWVDWRGGGLPESSPVQPGLIISNLSELTYHSNS